MCTCMRVENSRHCNENCRCYGSLVPGVCAGLGYGILLYICIYMDARAHTRVQPCLCSLFVLEVTFLHVICNVACLQHNNIF